MSYRQEPAQEVAAVLLVTLGGVFVIASFIALIGLICL